VGAGLFVLLEHWLGGVSDHWLIFLGAALLLVVLFARGGLIGGIATGRRS
jgi:branched-chain amino acid transport system permease protein